MAFIITTTGTQNPVTFSDLGGISFIHPTVSYNLESQYSKEEIANSSDVQAALTAGYITAVDEAGNSITTVTVVGRGYLPRIETFTATAGQTIFTLAATPVLNSELVFVDGAVQKLTDSYAVTSNVVTFGTGIFLGQVVIVKYWS